MGSAEFPRAEEPASAVAAVAPGDAAGEIRRSLASGASRGRVPDFFIVGHQKCGTTALHLMLQRHHEIFMPELKEPKFLAPDLRSPYWRPAQGPRRGDQRPDTFEQYLELFAPAREGQRIGEASPQYLRSLAAPELIAAIAPQARIIAILREPAAFLRSFHQQMLSSHVETEPDLARALELEGARREGREIPPRCHHPEALRYSDHVRYVEQLRRFEAVLPRERMLVLIYDDFRRDNAATLRRVLRFLDVQETETVAAVETRPLQGVRVAPLHRMAHSLGVARRNPAAAGPLWRLAGALAPARVMQSERLRSSWRRVVYGGAPAPPDDELMLELRRRFRPEVAALGEHLGRDLLAEWG